MPVLNCSGIAKAYDGKSVLKEVSLLVEAREKVALIGINGAGKTTIFKIITGEETPDNGNVTFSKDVTFGYLAQNQNVTGENTIYEELKEAKRDVIRMEEEIRDAEAQMALLNGKELDDLMERYERMRDAFQRAEGFQWQSEVTGVAFGLGFTEDELSKKISVLSGGQKTRVALGKLLLTKPDIIFLDEPTNHLDLNSIKWLETYLMNYKGAVVVISHDRYFLDRIAEKVVEIENGVSRTYKGNYTDYAEKKAALRKAKLRAYLNQQQKIKHEQEVIDKLKSFNREKSIKRAESREKQLAKIDVLDKPAELNDEMNLTLSPGIESGKDVLFVEGLSKRFGDEVLFEGASFALRKGEHVAVIGDNGTGKSTLLRILTGKLKADEGEVRLGVKVENGYYDQEMQVLHEDKTLFDEISDDYPALDNTTIRTTLAAFLFTGDDVFKRVADLSGGEKGRLSLAKLMLSKANFLLLDEPTNHLDMTSREVLESALNAYTGTVLYVSHDRYFINRTAERILELRDGGFTDYPGNYDYYEEKSEKKIIITETAPPKAATVSAVPNDYKQQKQLAAAKRKRENDLKKCEEEIARLEDEKRAIEEELSDPAIATDLASVRKRSDALIEIEGKLEELYLMWEHLEMTHP